MSYGKVGCTQVAVYDRRRKCCSEKVDLFSAAFRRVLTFTSALGYCIQCWNAFIIRPEGTSVCWSLITIRLSFSPTSTQIPKQIWRSKSCLLNHRQLKSTQKSSQKDVNFLSESAPRIIAMRLHVKRVRSLILWWHVFVFGHSVSTKLSPICPAYS